MSTIHLLTAHIWCTHVTKKHAKHSWEYTYVLPTFIKENCRLEEDARGRSKAENLNCDS